MKRDGNRIPFIESGSYPIHYASPKLRRVAPPRHIVLLSR